MPKQLTLSQSRFLANRTAQVPAYTWQVPITYRTATAPAASALSFLPQSGGAPPQRVPAPASPTAWFKLDADERFFYVVNYTPANWALLSSALAAGDPALSPEDRAGLVYDVFALSRAGHLNVSHALELTQFLVRETSYDVWSAALAQYAYIDVLVRDTPDYGLFLQHMTRLIGAPLQVLGLNDTGTLRERELRGLLVYYGAKWQLTRVHDMAHAAFAQWMAHGVGGGVAFEVDADFRSGVYSVGVSEGNTPEWEFVLAAYHNATVSAEQRRLLAALADTRQPWLLARLLAYALDTTEIRAQDAISVIGAVAANPIGRALAWDWFRAHWSALYARYGGSMTFGSLLTAVVSRFDTPAQYADVVAFFRGVNGGLGAAQSAYNQALSSIQSNIQWVQRNYAPLIAWLRSNP